MRALAATALTLALVASAAPALAQGRAARREAGGPAAAGALYFVVEGDPVGLLLERGDSLALTDDQTARLLLLRREARRANRTIADSLSRMGIERPEPGDQRRELTPEQKEAIRPLEEAARENNRLARDSALKLLTEAQRERYLRWERTRRPGLGLPGDTMPARRPPTGGRFSQLPGRAVEPSAV